MNRQRRSDFLLFLLVAFSMAWAAWGLCWLLGNDGASAANLTPIVIAGSFGPFVAAGLCTARTGGAAGVLAFYRRIFEWRMGWTVLALSLGLVPLIAIGVAAVFDGHLPAMGALLADLPRLYLFLLILGGPVGEEFGWSYVSDLLDKRVSLEVATVILGLIWAVWHLPLFFLDIPGLSQRLVPFPAFLAMSLAMRGLFSWTYHQGGRNILSNLLMHNGLNVGLSLVTIVLPQPESAQPRLWAVSAVVAVVAIILWRLWPIRPTEVAVRRGGHSDRESRARAVNSGDTPPTRPLPPA